MSFTFIEEKIKLINVKLPKGRLRKAYGNIDELAIDLEQHGLLQPIILNNDHTLIAGERRFLATQRLDRKTIRASVCTKQLTPVEAYIMEHAENVQRKDFTWQERCAAEAMFYQTQKELHPHSTANSAAKALNISKGNLSISIQLASAAIDTPDLYKQTSKEKAYRIYKRQVETAVVAEKIARNMTQIEEQLSEHIIEDAKDATAADSLHNKLLTVQKRVQANVLLRDCISGIKDEKDNSINLTLLDPPWGVNIEKQSSLSATGTFDDNKDHAFELLDTLLKELFPKMYEHSILLLFFPMELESYNLVFKLANQYGYRAEKLPLIWYKALETTHNTNPRLQPSVVYEPIYMLVKGMPYLMRPVSNVFISKPPMGSSRIHATQKPVELYIQLISYFSKQGDYVLDPTYGSGASMVAAEQAGNRLYKGFEINEMSYLRALDLVITAAMRKEQDESILDMEALEAFNDN